MSCKPLNLALVEQEIGNRQKRNFLSKLDGSFFTSADQNHLGRSIANKLLDTYQQIEKTILQGDKEVTLSEVDRLHIAYEEERLKAIHNFIVAICKVSPEVNNLFNRFNYLTQYKNKVNRAMIYNQANLNKDDKELIDKVCKEHPELADRRAIIDQWYNNNVNASIQGTDAEGKSVKYTPSNIMSIEQLVFNRLRNLGYGIKVEDLDKVSYISKMRIQKTVHPYLKRRDTGEETEIQTTKGELQNNDELDPVLSQSDKDGETEEEYNPTIESINIDIKQSLTPYLKFLISFIPKGTTKFGFPEFVNEDEIYAKLLAICTPYRSFDAMVNAMQKYGQTDPAIAKFVSKLLADTQIRSSLSTQFTIHFSQLNNAISSLILNKDGDANHVLVGEAAGRQDIAESMLGDIFMQLNDEYVYLEQDTEDRTQYHYTDDIKQEVERKAKQVSSNIRNKKWSEITDNDIEDMRDTFRLLGIYLSNEDFKKFVDNSAYSIQTGIDTPKHLAGLFEGWGNKTGGSIIGFVNSPVTLKSYKTERVLRVAAYIKFMGDPTLATTSSYYDGKSFFNYSKPEASREDIQAVTQDQSFRDRKQRIPFSKDNPIVIAFEKIARGTDKIWDSLRNTEEHIRTNFKVSTLLKYENKATGKSVPVGRMSEREYYTAGICMMFEDLKHSYIGTCMFPAMSDKERLLCIHGVPMSEVEIDNLGKSNIPAFLAGESKLTFNKVTVEEYFNTVILPEIRRINHVRTKGPREGSPDYVQGYDLPQNTKLTDSVGTSFVFNDALNKFIIDDEGGGKYSALNLRVRELLSSKHLEGKNPDTNKTDLEELKAIFLGQHPLNKDNVINEMLSDMTYSTTMELMSCGVIPPDFATKSTRKEKTIVPNNILEHAKKKKGATTRDRVKLKVNDVDTMVGDIETYIWMSSYYAINSSRGHMMFCQITRDPALYAKPVYDKNGAFNIQASVQKTWDNLTKRRSGELGPKNAQQARRYDAIFIKDVTHDDPTYMLERIRANMDKDGLLKTPAGLQQFNLYESSLKGVQLPPNTDLSLVTPYAEIYSAYMGIEFADGQEYMTLEECLLSLIDDGKLTKEEAGIPTRNAEGQYVVDDTLKQGIFYKLYNGEPIYNLSVQKALCYGTMVDGTDDQRVEMVKTSTITLLPKITAGTKLDALRVVMERNGIGRAGFDSTHKVGQRVLADGKTTASAEKIEDVTDDYAKEHKVTLSKEIQGDQQYTDKKVKEWVTISTQLLKQAFEDLDISQVYEFFGGTVSALQLRQWFEESKEQGVIHAFNKLVTDLGMEKVEKKYVINDFRLVRNKIIQAMRSLKLGFNAELGLDLTEGTNNTFEFPLAFNPLFNRIEPIIAALFHRGVNPPIPGNAPVLVSEANLFRSKKLGGSNPAESNIAGEVGKVKNGIIWNRLPEDQGGLTANDIKALEEGRLPEDGMLIPSHFKDEEGNTITEFSKIDPRLLEVYGARIPGQGLKSSHAYRIIGFLPPELGNNCIVSRFRHVPMGSDFDVDKLPTLYKPYKIENGICVPYTYNIVDGKLVTDGLMSSHTALIDTMIARAKNQHDNVAKTIPNTMGKLPEIGKQQQELLERGKLRVPASSLVGQSRRRFNGTVSKSGVGAMAVWVSDVYKIQVGKATYTPKYVTFIDLINKGNEIALETVNTAYTDSPIPKAKSEVFSYFLSALVDLIKNISISYNNLNNVTYNAVCSGVLLGFDEDYICRVVNHPAVRILTEELKKQQDSNGKLGFATEDDIKKIIKDKFNKLELKENMVKVNKETFTIDKDGNSTMPDSTALAVFLELNNLGAEIKKRLAETRTDTEKMSSFEGLMSLLKSKGSTQDSKWSPIKMSQEANLPYLQAKMLYGVEVALQCFDGIVPSTNNNLRTIIQDIYDDETQVPILDDNGVETGQYTFKGTGEKREDFNKKVINQYISYVLSHFVRPDTLNKYAHRQNGALHLIQDIREEYFNFIHGEYSKNPDYQSLFKNNYFLKNLSIGIDSKTLGEAGDIDYVSFLKTNIDADTVSNDLYTLLYNEDPTIREFARKLVDYNLLTGGNMSTYFPIYRFLPVQYLTQVLGVNIESTKKIDTKLGRLYTDYKKVSESTINSWLDETPKVEEKPKRVRSTKNFLKALESSTTKGLLEALNDISSSESSVFSNFKDLIISNEKLSNVIGQYQVVVTEGKLIHPDTKQVIGSSAIVNRYTKTIHFSLPKLQELNPEEVEQVILEELAHTLSIEALRNAGGEGTKEYQESIDISKTLIGKLRSISKTERDSLVTKAKETIDSRYGDLKTQAENKKKLIDKFIETFITNPSESFNNDETLCVEFVGQILSNEGVKEVIDGIDEKGLLHKFVIKLLKVINDFFSGAKNVNSPYTELVLTDLFDKAINGKPSIVATDINQRVDIQTPLGGDLKVVHGFLTETEMNRLEKYANDMINVEKTRKNTIIFNRSAGSRLQINYGYFYNYFETVDENTGLLVNGGVIPSVILPSGGKETFKSLEDFNNKVFKHDKFKYDLEVEVDNVKELQDAVEKVYGKGAMVYLPAEPMPKYLLELGELLFKEGIITEIPDSALINVYPAGTGGINPHTDNTDFGDEIVTIRLEADSVLSFGYNQFASRYNENKDIPQIFSKDSPIQSPTDVPLYRGSIAVMKGGVRYKLKHGIRAESTRGRSISITLRKVKNTNTIQGKGLPFSLDPKGIDRPNVLPPLDPNHNSSFLDERRSTQTQGDNTSTFTSILHNTITQTDDFQTFFSTSEVTHLDGTPLLMQTGNTQVYAKVESPVELDSTEEIENLSQEQLRELKNLDIDGAIVRDENGEIDNVYLFNLNQIYSEPAKDVEDTFEAKQEIQRTALEEKVRSFLAKLGITVRDIKDLKSKYGVDIQGVADITNNLIEVLNGADPSVLTEECFHIIYRSMLNTPHGQYLLNHIHEWKGYKDIVAEYNDVYKGDNAKVREEAVVKLLTQSFLANPESTSMVQRAIEVVQRFFKKLGLLPTDEFQDSIQRITDILLNEKIELIKLSRVPDNTESKLQDLMYALNTKQQETIVEEYKNILREARNNKRYNRGFVDVLSKTIRERISKVNRANVVETILDSAREDGKWIAERLNIPDHAKNLTSQDILMLRQFIDSYKKILSNETCDVNDAKDKALAATRRDNAMRFYTDAEEELGKIIMEKVVEMDMENTFGHSLDPAIYDAVKKEFAPIDDISVVRAEATDVTTNPQILAQYAGKLISRTLTHINQDSQDFLEQANEIYQNFVQAAQSIGMTPLQVYNKFFKEVDDNGEPTGNTVDKYKSAYHDAMQVAISEYLAEVDKTTKIIDEENHKIFELTERLNNPALSNLQKKPINRSIADANKKIKDASKSKAKAAITYLNRIEGNTTSVMATQAHDEWVAGISPAGLPPDIQTLIANYQGIISPANQLPQPKEANLLYQKYLDDLASVQTNLSPEEALEWEFRNNPTFYYIALEAHRNAQTVKEKAALEETIFAFRGYEYVANQPAVKWQNPQYDVIMALPQPIIDFYEFYTEKVKETRNYLPEVYVKGERKTKRNILHIPELVRSVAERIETDGFFKALRPIISKGMVDFWTDKLDGKQNKYIDPVTGKIRYTVPFFMISGDETVDRTHMTEDLYKALIAFHTMGINYRYKEAVSAQAELVKGIADNIEAVDANFRGEFKASNTAFQIQYYIDAMVYEQRTQEKQIVLKDDKIYNKDERAQIEKLEKEMIDIFEAKYAMLYPNWSSFGHKQKVQLIHQEAPILNDYDIDTNLRIISELGTVATMQSVLEGFLNYSRIKALAFNIPSALNEGLAGFINTVIAAGDGTFFNDSQCSRAYEEVMTGSLLGINSKKKRTIEMFARKFGIDNRINEALFRGKNKIDMDLASLQKGNWRSKFKLNNLLDPDTLWYLQEKMGLINYHTSMVGILLNTPITLSTGEVISMYEGYEDGKWLHGATDPDPLTNFDTLNEIKDKIKGYQNMTHGAYDSDRPVAFQRHIWGKVLMGFKKWLPNAIMNRIGARREDKFTGKTVEGRWLAYKTLYTDPNSKLRVYDMRSFGVAALGTAAIAGLAVTDARYFHYIPFLNKLYADKDLSTKYHELEWLGLDETSRESMKRNMREFQLIVLLFLMTQMLRAWDTDDDDSVQQMAIQYSINQASRLWKESTFFYNPTNYVKLMEEPAVVVSGTIENLWDLIAEASKTLVGQDGMGLTDYETTSNRGQNRLGKAVIDVIPAFSGVRKAYRAAEEVLPENAQQGQGS